MELHDMVKKYNANNAKQIRHCSESFYFDTRDDSLMGYEYYLLSLSDSVMKPIQGFMKEDLYNFLKEECI